MTENQFDLATAIDFCDSAFVFVDNNFVVQYLNFKAFGIFQQFENSFKSMSPDFCFYDLVDHKLECLYQLLENEHQEAKFHSLDLGETLTLYKHFDDVTFKIKITPIYQVGKRKGACLEFVDVTDLYNAKKQFDIAIDAGNRGDFSYRIDTQAISDKGYLFHEVYEKLNTHFETLNNFVEGLSISLENISSGNLSYCSHELALIPESRQEQLECSTCPQFDKCLNKNYVNPEEIYHEDNYLHTIRKDVHYTFQNLWDFVNKIRTSQFVLENSIKTLVESYSEIAMSTEVEYMKANQIQEVIDERLSLFKNISCEIDQATHVRDITSSNEQIVIQLRDTLLNIGHQVEHVSHIAQTLDNIFSHHAEGLQSGLNHIKLGNLGKGIAIINEQSGEIIHKSKTAMREIREAIRQMSQSFQSSNSSIGDIVDSVIGNMNSMNQQIDMYNLMMSSIQQAVKMQEETSNEIKVFSEDFKTLLSKTMEHITQMMTSTADLVGMNLNLKDSLNVFQLQKLMLNPMHQHKVYLVHQ